MTRFRTFFLLCLLALAVPIVIAGCGSDDSNDEDPQTVLDETFNNDTKVSSGDLSLSASVNAEGEQGGNFEFSLSGPFQGDPDNENTLPQLDWTASASGEGAGQSIDFSGGLVVTADNAFVEYNDQAYEVGTEAFTQLKQAFEAQAAQQAGNTDAQGTFQEQCATAIEQAGGDASACDIDLQSWLTELTNEGTEDVGGTESVHIHGDVNVEQMLTDIGNLASSVPQASSSGFDPSQLSAVSGAVTDASIDVYSGEEDDILRKLDFNLTVDPSALAPEGVTVPVGEITIDFGVEIAGLNEEQTIDAPSGAKPINELLSDLGVDPSQIGAIPGLPGGSSGGSGGGGDYLQCVEQASTPAEINECASEL